VAKTVTLQSARGGRRSVTVDGTRFPLGEAVRDVSEQTLKKLKALPDVKVHVAPSTRPRKDEPDPEPDTSTTPDEPPEAEQ